MLKFFKEITKQDHMLVIIQGHKEDLVIFMRLILVLVVLELFQSLRRITRFFPL